MKPRKIVNSDDEDVRQQRKVLVAEIKRHYQGVAETIAGDGFYKLRYRWKNDTTDVRPGEAYVDKFFPHAKEGPLLIDEPSSVYDFEECLKKKKLMEEKGLRYLIVVPKKNPEEILEQFDKEWAVYSDLVECFK